MRLVVIICLFFCLISIRSFSQNSEAGRIKGVWIPQQNKSRVEIFEKDGKYCGKIIWLKDIHNLKGEEICDLNNPVINHRRRHIVGMIFMWGFEFEDGCWKNGNLYDPETGNTYTGVIRMSSEDVLLMRGYISIPLFGRTSVWQREKNKDDYK